MPFDLEGDFHPYEFYILLQPFHDNIVKRKASVKPDTMIFCYNQLYDLL